ncbi:transglycosylase SLT domain-containing protein [Dasania sp. GY-MA-18]|uniref:Transglycosylase SLT domain-containing protein n=1 Tax=Dasania phycosphaerae TaxID=2950436 RepID=A0A9J6RJM5_9GAMM|nr:MULTISPECIES: transglycosylase SLT domain-containing protein [Dasania]MCR8921753.1 transglycosylase SLT domain-containing protein [Dasania sp. GY-MA-18]MCZ0864181.1 transglycosylase SLT domain-containing protein [Dasania phycosphaerae]MCZ0867909.1 transglycosylase SLT domain-containing protein [Dasania phycosphaerae]
MAQRLALLSLNRIKVKHWISLASGALLLGLSSGSYASPVAASPDVKAELAPAQIQLYQDTLIAIRKGQLKQAEKGLYQLKDFPLAPYIEKHLLYKRMHQLSSTQALSFLNRHQGSVVAQQFRQKWLSHLAKQQRWQDFLSFYVPTQSSTALHCQYLSALHHSGKQDTALQQTQPLWLSARSLPDACDLPLQRWQQAGLLTDDLMWQRIILAIKHDNHSLVNYLHRRANPGLQAVVQQLRHIHRQPQDLAILQANAKLELHYQQAIALYGIERLADKNLALVLKHWPSYQQQFVFNTQQQQQLKQIIARQLIASGDSQALSWLIKNDPNGDDVFLLEWRILLAIKNQQWQQAQRWLGLLPSEHQQQPQWQYWQARAAIKLQNNQYNSLEKLQALSQQRHYYGFLAAELLGQPYVFEHNRTPSHIDTHDLQQRPAIQRAKVFYLLGESIAARREWHHATRHFTPQQHINASLLAHQWGWHQQAIMSAAKSDYKDDLELRFPMAYQQTIMPVAKATAVQPAWIYAVTRQESAFAADATSSAGAKGLMQLRPGTAKDVAQLAGLSFKRKDLYQADTNLLLGSHYLQQLLDTFEGNKILATAAFNAGPYRVKRWLNQQVEAMDYDIWIDTLPYYETRNYIKNVLASSLIYSHLMGNSRSLVDSHEQKIALPSNAASTAL